MTSSRPPARHCSELLGRPPSLEELVPALSLFGEKLVRALPLPLARVLGGDTPVVRMGMPMDCTLAAIQSDLDMLASHALLGAGPKALPLLATFEAAPVFRLLDRAYGGSGSLPEPLPDAFPLSAELLLARLEAAVGEALDLASGRLTPVQTLRRDSSLRQLDPFERDSQVLKVSFEVEERDCDPWAFALAFPLETLAALLEAQPRKARKAGPQGPSASAGEPFASMPLELRAVLVDMPVPMHRLASLKPGDVLPVPVARAVPVQLGCRTIGTGTLGELDDRIAVQLGQAF